MVDFEGCLVPVRERRTIEQLFSASRTRAPVKKGPSKSGPSKSVFVVFLYCFCIGLIGLCIEITILI